MGFTSVEVGRFLRALKGVLEQVSGIEDRLIGAEEGWLEAEKISQLKRV